MFILFVCGGAAWTAEVSIVRSVMPPSRPPPAGGRSRTPSPRWGEGWGGGRSPCPRRRDAGVPPALPGRVHRAVCAMRMTVSRDHGGTWLPHTPARGRVWEGYALTQGAWETGLPHPRAPGKVRAQPVRRGLGKPGCPSFKHRRRPPGCDRSTSPRRGGERRCAPSLPRSRPWHRQPRG